MSRRPATDPDDRLAALVALGEADPATTTPARADGDALATTVGGELELRWRIAVVRGCMLSPPDADSVRELYGELVDRYRDEAASMAKLRALGDDIRARETDGSLARTMVARSNRRKT